jgi:hypothetical protein
MMGLRTRCGYMAIHPTMNLGHPTTEVVYLILKIISVHGALGGSKTRNMPAAAHALPAYRFFSHHSSIMHEGVRTSALDRSHSSPKRYTAINWPTN